MKRRETIFTIGALLLLIALSACGRSNEQNGANNANASESGITPGGFHYILESGIEYEFEITMLAPIMYQAVIMNAQRQMQRALPEN